MMTYLLSGPIAMDTEGTSLEPFKVELAFDYHDAISKAVGIPADMLTGRDLSLSFTETNGSILHFMEKWQKGIREYQDYMDAVTGWLVQQYTIWGGRDWRRIKRERRRYFKARGYR